MIIIKTTNKITMKIAVIITGAAIAENKENILFHQLK